MNITLCVSVPEGGLPMVKILAHSAVAMASGKHNLQLDFTYNYEADRDAILAANLPIPIGKHHFVERKEGTRLTCRSITHSRCINVLFAGADGDVCVLWDYDAAVAHKGWDEVLVDKIIRQNIAFFGTPYSTMDSLPIMSFGNTQVVMLKYQKKPNAIFLAYAPARIKALTDKICTFADDYGGDNDVPAMFIANARQSACYGIPIASFVNLDTGYRIAEMIEEHQLPWESLTRRVEDYRVMKFPEGVMLDQYKKRYWPEEYDLDDTPFLAHFRKGSLRTKEMLAVYSREQFVDDVKAYIAKAA